MRTVIMITKLTLRIHTLKNTMFDYTWNDLLDDWKPEMPRSGHTYTGRIYFVLLLLMKGRWRCHPTTCHLGISLFWAERNWEKADLGQAFCPLPIYLKMEHKFLLWQCFLTTPSPRSPIFLMEGDNLNPETRRNHEKVYTHKSYFLTSPYLLLDSLNISTFPQLAASGSSKSFSIFWSLLYNFIVLLLRCYITPSSNYSYELFITEYSHTYVWCMGS